MVCEPNKYEETIFACQKFGLLLRGEGGSHLPKHFSYTDKKKKTMLVKNAKNNNTGVFCAQICAGNETSGALKGLAMWCINNNNR